MTDPFQDLDAFSSDFLNTVVDALENRAAETQIVPIIDAYLDDLDWVDHGLHLEIGTGSGPIARQMASRAVTGTVVGVDPSEGLIANAITLGAGHNNLGFEVGNGDALRFDSDTAQSVVMHTLLSHVDNPQSLLAEAFRVLKPGGKLVVCDTDFIKTSLDNFYGDPLGPCIQYFVQHFVTQPYLISSVREMAKSVGFTIEDFRITSRAITSTAGGLGFFMKMGTKRMVDEGLIGEKLASSLVEEYERRYDDGTLYGHQPFCTMVASKQRTPISGL